MKCVLFSLQLSFFNSPGGILASIEDPDEQQFIQQTVEVFKGGHSSFWIGLYKTHKGLSIVLAPALFALLWGDFAAHVNKPKLVYPTYCTHPASKVLQRSKHLFPNSKRSGNVAPSLSLLL